MNIDEKIAYEFPIEFIKSMEEIRKMCAKGYGAIDYSIDGKKITIALIFKEEDVKEK